jgi:hypothetical protein
VVSHLLKGRLSVELARFFLITAEAAASVGQAGNYLAQVPVNVEATAELIVVLSIHLLALVQQTLLLKNLVLHEFEFEG